MLSCARCLRLQPRTVDPFSSFRRSSGVHSIGVTVLSGRVSRKGALRTDGRPHISGRGACATTFTHFCANNAPAQPKLAPLLQRACRGRTHQEDCGPARRSASSHRARPTSSPRPSARGATSGWEVTSAVVTARASGMRTRMSPGAAPPVATRPPGAGATPLDRSPREAAHSSSAAGDRGSTATAEEAAPGRVRWPRAPRRAGPPAPRTAARRLTGRTPCVVAAHRMLQLRAAGAGVPRARVCPCPTRARHQPGAGAHAAVHSGMLSDG
jgi:hypothetical protein